MSFNPINSAATIANVISTVDNDPASAFRVQSDTRLSSTIDNAISPTNTRNPLTGSWHVSAFGATGNGVTGDTNAISAAKNAAGIGGVVYFGPGTYIVDGLLLDIDGQSWILDPQATIKLKTSSSSQYSIRVSADNVTISGGTMDGNRAGNAGGTHFQVRGVAGFKLSDMLIRNAYSNSLQLVGVKDSEIRRVKFRDGRSTSIFLTSDSTFGNCDNVLIDGIDDDHRVTTYANAGGISSYVANGSVKNRNIRVTNSRILLQKPTSGALGNVGIFNTDDALIANNYLLGGNITVSIAGNDTAQRAKIIGNTIVGFNLYGLEFAESASCVAQGNTIEAGAAGGCLTFNGAAKDNIVQGNAMTGGDSPCVYLSSESSGNTLTSNNFTQTGTTGAIVSMNGAKDINVNNNTFTGTGGVNAALRAFSTTGDISFNGNTINGMTEACLIFDITPGFPTTTNHVVATGNRARTTPQMLLVRSGAAVGSDVTIVSNSISAS